MGYKPLRPCGWYLDAGLWDRLLAERAVAACSPFGGPEKGAAAVDAGGRRGRNCADGRAKPGVHVFEELREHIADLRQNGRRVVIAGYTHGARERLRTVLMEHGVVDVDAAETWTEVRSLDSRIVAAAVLPI